MCDEDGDEDVVGDGEHGQKADGGEYWAEVSEVLVVELGPELPGEESGVENISERAREGGKEWARIPRAAGTMAAGPNPWKARRMSRVILSFESPAPSESTPIHSEHKRNAIFLPWRSTRLLKNG